MWVGHTCSHVSVSGGSRGLGCAGADACGSSRVGIAENKWSSFHAPKEGYQEERSTFVVIPSMQVQGIAHEHVFARSTPDAIFHRQAEVRTWLHEQAHIGMGHKRRLLCGWVSQRNGSCLGRRVFQVGLVSNPQSNSDWGDNQNRHPTDAGLGQAREVAWEAAVNAHRCRTGRHHVRQVSAEATSVRG